MIEVFVLLMVLILLKVCLFSSKGCMSFFSQSAASIDGDDPADGLQSNTHGDAGTFLTYLKKEIEAELFPRPTDSILRRHYEALVQREVEARLVLMSE